MAISYRMRIFCAFLMAALFACPAAAETLKIATWNIEWLTDRPDGDPALPADVTPKAAGDVALLRGYADRLAADVIAFQEVDGPAMAARIFPPDRYAIHTTADHVVQRVGLAIRRGITFTANPDLLGLDLYPDAKYHLRSGADVTLDLPGGRLRVLAVHLKTGCRQDLLSRSKRPQCATLLGQLAPLQGWIAQRRAEGAAFVLLGDFNRWMEPPDQFWPALQTSAPLSRATAGRSSPCWDTPGFIDHIIAGGAARGWMQPDTLRVLVYRETGAAWKERLSDHCPVSVGFQIPD
jgi:endonuclease/exonuclease/phosphatase family metal-dependent hydrolase